MFEVNAIETPERTIILVRCYFLTDKAMVENLTSELESLFRSTRAGGVVVAVGAISGQYRKVYKAVDQIARRELMKRREKLHSRIPLSYSDQYTGRIKALYRKV